MTEESYEKQMSKLMEKSNWSEEHRQLALRWKKQCRIRLEWALRYARNHNIKFI